MKKLKTFRANQTVSRLIEIAVINHDSPPIDNRTAIGKLKEFLGWNRAEYPVAAPSEDEGTPSRPPRRKRPSRNSVAPENGSVKAISSPTQMHVKDIENNDEEKRKDEENHIWQERALILSLNGPTEYPARYYNIPHGISYIEWLTQSAHKSGEH